MPNCHVTRSRILKMADSTTWHTSNRYHSRKIIIQRVIRTSNIYVTLCSKSMMFLLVTTKTEKTFNKACAFRKCECKSRIEFEEWQVIFIGVHWPSVWDELFILEFYSLPKLLARCCRKHVNFDYKILSLYVATKEKKKKLPSFCCRASLTAIY